MKRLLLAPLIALITLTGCEKLDIAPGIPNCLKKKIRIFNKQSKCEDREPTVKASVEEYKFQNRTVYILNEGNCNPDSGSQVIDSDCNNIGYLGGFTGNTKIDGIDFNTSATLIRVVWND